MNPLTAFAVQLVGAGGAAALPSVGAAGVLVQAASPTPNPAPVAGAPAGADRHTDRKLVRQAVLEAEADVLGIPEGTLISDLKKGQKVSDLANDRHMSRDEFAKKLAAALKPRLEQLVDHKQITQAQADRVLDRIAKGHIPFWNGLH